MSTTTSSGARAGRWLILGAVCLAALIPPLGFTGGAVAMPAIGRELGGSPFALNWIVNGYMLAFGSTLMAAGALSDQYGRKKVFSTGVGLFVLASLLLAGVSQLPWLNLLRGAQGLAGAMILAGGTAALAQEFDGPARTRAFAMLGTTFGIGLAFGPVLTGWLIQDFGWRASFLTGAAAGVLALLLGVPKMHESRDPGATGLDWPGSISFTAALGALTLGIMQAPLHGWLSAQVTGLLSAAFALMVLFVWIERRVRRPMLDLSLFRYTRFIGVQALPLATCYCYVVLLIMLPIRFIGIEGHSELDAGWMLMTLSLPMLVVPAMAASLAHRIPAGVLCGAGLLLAAVGLLYMSRIAPGQSVWDWAVPMLLVGVGSGMPWGLMDGLSVSVVPRERAGMATGIFSTTRVAGECIGLALMSAVLVGLLQWRLHVAMPSVEIDVVNATARQLAAGNRLLAMAPWPDAAHAALITAYSEAFRWVMYVLAAITTVSALVVFGFLGKAGAAPEADANSCAVL
ncbi:MFS transporter [Dyella caseinilytica]|uniref:MFS transporter n=1 Tax=Dyella caseinilytica TaxID=1849581 RepID=A0ABX7GW82_9GAMM|nr:MFS transporter [Dyella caseinilytica]QRN54129.1 MFS transporter [Dyella caseinilytica]GFZ91737.1 MFS transporter [Dyella caseinilytica]